MCSSTCFIWPMRGAAAIGVFSCGPPSTGCAQGVRQMPDVAGLGRDQGKLSKKRARGDD